MTSRQHTLAWVLAATALALSACSDQKTQDQAAATPPPAVGTETRTPAATPQPAPAPVAGQTVGGDGSEIQLSEVTFADMRANPTEGELGCSFEAGGVSLLRAQGFVASKDAAQGLVKVTGYIERIAAPGGFDGLVNGATFTGQGKTIVIKITGKATGGGESPPNPATLTYQRADGASKVVTGTWTCGP
jgi:hypothetical protein